jgi:hypothetical protein
MPGAAGARGSAGSVRSVDGGLAALPLLRLCDVVLRVNGVVCTLESDDMVEAVETLSNTDGDGAE